MRPLDGIIVVDLTRLLPGAWASQVLADFGAEVIKVEEPPLGDPGRQFGAFHGDESKLFSLTNRGKKSVAINLKDGRGSSAFLRIVSRADVLIEGFRPGVMHRLGLSHKKLCRLNPRLIYASISGYGQSGPDASLPGHDINYISLAGLLDLMGNVNSSPSIPPVQVADLVGGALQAIIGILFALVCRSTTGRGQVIDVAMLDGMAPLLLVPMAMRVAHEQGQLSAGLLTGSFACYNVYKAADDRWISVGALESKFWRTICETLGCQEFIDDQFTGEPRQSQMITTLAQIFRQKDACDWFKLLKHACVTPVVRVSQDHPNVSPKLSVSPGRRAGKTPRLGQDTREVLISSGLKANEINRLAHDRIILMTKGVK